MRIKKTIKKFYQEEISSIVYKKPQLPHKHLKETEIQKSFIFKELIIAISLNIFILIIGVIGLSTLNSDKYNHLTFEFLDYQTSEVRNNIINNYRLISGYFENKNK